jgi:hypothetical protein
MTVGGSKDRDCWKRQKGRKTKRQIDKKTDRQKDRKTERQKIRKTDRQKVRKTDRQKDRETKRQIDKKTDRQKDRKTVRQKIRKIDRHVFLTFFSSWFCCKVYRPNFAHQTSQYFKHRSRCQCWLQCLNHGMGRWNQKDSGDSWCSSFQTKVFCNIIWNELMQNILP